MSQRAERTPEKNGFFWNALHSMLWFLECIPQYGSKKIRFQSALQFTPKFIEVNSIPLQLYYFRKYLRAAIYSVPYKHCYAYRAYGV